MTIEITVIIPDRIFWKSTAKELILPTLNGQMGILINHIPLLTGLETGIVLIRNEPSDPWFTIIVTGGFALINNNKITILVNEAEFGSDINFQEANAQYIESKLALETNSDVKKNFELSSQFKKAKARLQVGEILKAVVQ